MNPRSKAIAFLILMTAIWGTSFPMMRCLNLQIDQHFDQLPETNSVSFRAAAASWMVGLRFSFAFVLFLVFFPQITRQVRLQHIVAGLSIGLMFFVGVVLQVIGLATIPASRSGFLTSLVVVFIPLISTIIRRKAPPASILFAGFIALIGVSILTGLIDVGSGSVSWADGTLRRWTTGDSLTLLGAVFFSVQIILVDGFGKRHSSIEFTPTMFATIAICGWTTFGSLLLLDGAQNRFGNFDQWTTLGLQPTFWGLIALLATLPSLVAFALMNKFQPAVSAVEAGIIYTLEPVFASIFAMFLPAILSEVCRVTYGNEEFTLPLLIGGLLVIVANLLALKPNRSDTG